MAADTATTVLDEFVALTARKRNLERELRQLKDQIAPLEDQLLEQFNAEGVRGKRTSTGAMVSIRRVIWARPAHGDKHAACDALRAAGMGDYVADNFNVSTLSAFFRERAREQADQGIPTTLTDLMPPELVGAIDLTEDHQLSVTGS
jgi:hypothetical protein